MNNRCRRIMAVTLAGRLMPFYFWVRSADNPADAPSRVSDEVQPPQPAARADVLAPLAHSWSLRERVFVHLCSGPRRENDLGQAVQDAAAQEGMQLAVWMIDPVVSGGGSLLDEAVQAEVDALLLGGHVAALHAGPPCGLFSAARHRPMPSGARPLCSRHCLWEPLPGATEPERRTHARGCLLLALCLRFVYMAASRGHWACLAHPADPGGSRPSVFASVECAELRSHLHAKPFRLDQCMYGALTRKPIELLLPDVRHRAELSARCVHRRHVERLVGRTTGGSFRTSAAARYPPQLFAALARSVIASLHGQRRGRGPTEVQRAWAGTLASGRLSTCILAWAEFGPLPAGGRDVPEGVEEQRERTRRAQ